MKRLFLILTFFLLFTALFLDRSGITWSIERPLVNYLARVTGRKLPSAVAILLPETREVLSPQDVALTLRAVVSFHPRLILVAEPMGNPGSLTLINEALTTGNVSGVPVVFAATSGMMEQGGKEELRPWTVAPVTLFPQESVMLPRIHGRGTESSPWGFIDAKEGTEIPLLAQASDGSIVASLWWRGLFFESESLEQGVQKMMPVALLGGHFLMEPHHRPFYLSDGVMLKNSPHSRIKIYSLDDLLLHREEMERGGIRPDMDSLLRNQTLIVGRSSIIEKAALFQDAYRELSLKELPASLYGILFFLLAFGMMKLRRLPWIDCSLTVIFFLLCYGGAAMLIFRSYGILLPLSLPLITAFLSILGSSCLQEEGS